MKNCFDKKITKIIIKNKHKKLHKAFDLYHANYLLTTIIWFQGFYTQSIIKQFILSIYHNYL